MKGEYPYDYATSISVLNDAKLPSKDAFYSKLYDQHISDKDYKHAQKVWDTFGLQTFRHYHDLYNVADVLQLADIFLSFRDVCLTHYKLDPLWYYTAPGLAWDAYLKLTKVELDTLPDYEMILMIKAGTRGGVSSIMHRYAAANNKYMSNYNNKKRISIHQIFGCK